MKEIVRELQKGAYDLHVHTSPSHFSRRLDDFELAQELDNYSMTGAVIKVHYGATSTRAIIANQHSGSKAKLYGSLTLDWPVGGLNPYAVESEVLMGAKIIWLPTFHSACHLEHRKRPFVMDHIPPIQILDEKGKLLPVVYEILEIVKTHHAVLATGHLGVKESIAVCEAACEQGTEIILTHPENPREAFSLEEQKRLASKGVFIEKCWMNACSDKQKEIDMAEKIQQLPSERCFMSTDFGMMSKNFGANGGAGIEKKSVLTAPAGMAEFIATMLSQGVSSKKIEALVKITPSYLLREANQQAANGG